MAAGVAGARKGILNVAQQIDNETATERQERFLNDVGLRNGLGQLVQANVRWEGLLGDRSGFSLVGLMLGINTIANTVQDRAVVKEALCDKSSWYDPTFWDGPYTAQGHRDFNAGIVHNRHMAEVVHRLLSARTCPAINECRWWSGVNQQQWWYRLYLQFCSRGTLADMIDYFRDPEQFQELTVTRYKLDDDFTVELYDEDEDNVEDGWHVIPDVKIPEPFIVRIFSDVLGHFLRRTRRLTSESMADVSHFQWYVFDSLARAARVMEQGTETGARLAGWHPIVHRDIKPQSIFLSDPQTGPGAQWRLYPQPQLGDFGLACEANTADPVENNPRAYRGPGTRGFYAPEQVNWINRNTRFFHDTPLLGSTTNVYQIRMVIYCLVYRLPNPPQLQFSVVPGSRDGPCPPPNPTGPIPGPPYHANLMNLMWDCLEFAPERRPTPDEIRARITPASMTGLRPDTDHFNGMRKVVPTPGLHWTADYRGRAKTLPPRNDYYTVGLAENQLPAR